MIRRSFFQNIFLWECFDSSQVKLLELCRKFYIQYAMHRQSKFEGAESRLLRKEGRGWTQKDYYYYCCCCYYYYYYHHYQRCLPRKRCFSWYTAAINASPVKILFPTKSFDEKYWLHSLSLAPRFDMLMALNVFRFF